MSRPTQLALHKSFVSYGPTNAVRSVAAESGGHGEAEVGGDYEHPANAIDRKNGWGDDEFKTDQQVEMEEFVRETVIRECVKGYGEIFYFCYSGASGTLVPINTPANLQTAFTRFVSITRVLFPEVLQDKSGPLSQARVAALLGKSPTYIADVGTRFSENWRFYSRVQKTQSEKEASRQARLRFLDTKRLAPKVARQSNGKAVRNPLGCVRASSPSSSLSPVHMQRAKPKRPMKSDYNED